MITDNVKKVLIVERSEMGLRALEACVALGIDFVVGFSQADRNSLLVKNARKYSESMRGSGVAYIGAAPIEESYGNVSNIIETAKLWGCDAVYPGYGPLAEDHISIKRIEKAKLKFIGPSSEVVEIFSNRFKSRELAEKSGFKLLKAIRICSLAEIARILLDNELKYPFIMKSFFSGGGKGNYFIGNDDDLVKVLSIVELEKKQHYVEEYISGKHIEFQFVVDSEKVVSLGTRDCSCQIDFQKFLEECPGKSGDEKVKKIERKMNKMLFGMGYEGAGTAEFIYDNKKGEYFFLEINPRIQVEVPVTEKFFNIDIVKAQLLIADGQKIVVPEKSLSIGHVIEVRIYARDVFNGFKQCSEKIEKMIPPEIEGISVFSGYVEGETIPSAYDPLIMKIVSAGSSRKESIARLKKALLCMTIRGPVTNKELILWLIATDNFKNNQINQDFTKQAWGDYLKIENLEINSFLARGFFVENKAESEIDISRLPNELCYSRRGVVRNYKEELKSRRKNNPGRCAFRFGIFEREGVRCIFSWWDFSYFGGTLGVAEANSIRRCFEIANNKKLPILMISNSGGARQQENSFALHAMHYIIAMRKKYSVPLFVNIYYRDNFGGVNVSIVEQADIKIGVKGGKIGLAGPRFLSKIGDTFSGDDSVVRHYEARNIDLVVDSLESACEQTLSMFDLLFYRGEFCVAKKTDNKYHRIDVVEDNLPGSKECVALSLVEIINPYLQIFEKVTLLASREDSCNEYPSIMGAFVKIGVLNALVIGQHVPIIKKSDSGDGKRYSYPGAVDFRWFRRKMRLAEKMRIPVILFGDTLGASADTKSEYDGVSYYISNAIADQLSLTVPIISVNIGLCGSGGGLPFANTADFAIALGGSLKLVSDIAVQTAIMTGETKPTDKQQEVIMKQLVDATAIFQKKYHFIDKVILEKDKKKTAMILKNTLINSLQKLSNLGDVQLIARRLKRVERVIKNVSR